MTTKKSRPPLDLKGMDRNPGGARKGDVRNPAGKVAGTLTKSTNLGNEAKTSIIQTFQRSLAPQILATMLNGRLPLQFVPRALVDRHRSGKLTDDDEGMIARQLQANWKWAMDWMAKVFPKTLGAYGLMQTEETVAGRTKRATKEDKTPGVVEMVRRKVEDEMYEAGE